MWFNPECLVTRMTYSKVMEFRTHVLPVSYDLDLDIIFAMTNRYLITIIIRRNVCAVILVNDNIN